MPSPHKRSFAAEELARRQQKRPATIAIIVIAVMIAVIAVGYSLYMRYGTKKTTPVTVTHPAEEIKSIAVLPFVDMSPNKDQEHLGEGIADAVLNALTNISNLKVISRGSSFRYIGGYKDIQAIGDTLGVESILEGSVLKTGAKIRVIAQLIKVADNSHIFSRQYDYKWKDILALQDSISLEVLKELKFTLMGREKAAVVKRYTNNPDAYELYLQGRNTKGINHHQRLEYYQKAVGLDPEFALAYVCIAWTYYDLAIAYQLTWKEASEKAMPIIEKARAIDENLAELHSLLAALHTLDYDWDAAEKEYKKAIELNPGNAEVHSDYATYLGYWGRCEESLAENAIARKLDPLNMSSYSRNIRCYIILGRYDDALEEFNRGKAVDPNNSLLYQHLGRLYRKQGRYEEAVEAFKKEYDLSGRTRPHLGLGYTYALMGEREKAEQILDAILKRKAEGYGLSSSIALLYIALGDHDKAFEWLEKADEDEYWSVMFISDYEWDPIRSDPRYKALLKKMNLPVE